MACCPCMEEQANNSALRKSTLNFQKFAWETYRTEVSICHRKVPERASQKKVSCKDTGDCKGKETHLTHINDLSYCVLLGVT